MAQEGLNAAAAEAAGASGGARQQKLPEWYTVVVYERRDVKKVALYLGRRETVVFNVPVDVNIGNIAVIMRRWRVGDRTVACSASIHAANLAKLLRAYAPDAAEQLAPLLIARADGGS